MNKFPNGAGYYDYEDVPSTLYESEIRFRYVSDCCLSGIYKNDKNTICLNCTEKCCVIEDLILS